MTAMAPRRYLPSDYAEARRIVRAAVADVDDLDWACAVLATSGCALDRDTGRAIRAAMPPIGAPKPKPVITFQGSLPTARSDSLTTFLAWVAILLAVFGVGLIAGKARANFEATLEQAQDGVARW